MARGGRDRRDGTLEGGDGRRGAVREARRDTAGRTYVARVDREDVRLARRRRFEALALHPAVTHENKRSPERCEFR